jgi:hypothetical protein
VEQVLIRVLLKSNLEVVFPRRFFWGDEEKAHSLSVAPEPLAIWNKKLEGLESSEMKNLKNLL